MKALLIVDIQNDFLSGGALAVPGGNEVIPVANRLQAQFELVVATQDWHPANHGSFAANHPCRSPGEIIDLNGLNQILWPVHCVQNTLGAAFAPGLDTRRFAAVFQKGTDPGIDSYSAFFDNGQRKATGLGDFLKARQVKEVFIAGLTTDYCVRFSALDAVTLGFRTHVFQSGCRGVNLNAGDVRRAIEAMKSEGVQVSD